MDGLYLKQVTVMYVEDSRAMREILSRRLSKKVKNIIVAEDGEDGYNKYCEHKPDIVLTDIEMPKLNGFELSSKIKEENKDVIIIALSAHTDASFLLDALESGISGYLVKPVDKDKLHYQLESYARIICLDKTNQIQKNKIDELEKYILDLKSTHNL